MPGSQRIWLHIHRSKSNRRSKALILILECIDRVLWKQGDPVKARRPLNALKHFNRLCGCWTFSKACNSHKENIAFSSLEKILIVNNGNSERLYFFGSRITADDDYSHEIKRCLLLGRKAMTNLDSVLKSRDITNKGPSSQS